VTKTLIGIAMGPDGISSTRSFENGRLRTRGWATPPTEFRRRQAARIPIDICHDGSWVGECIYLERSKGGQLWAIGHADIADPPEWMGPMFWSCKSNCYEDGTDVELEALAIGPSHRAHGLQPLKILDGKVDHRHVAERWGWRDQLNSYERELLTRAANYHLDRQRGAGIIVHDVELDHRDLDRLTPVERHIALVEQADAQVGDPYWKNRPWRYRPCGRIISVH
jgi:hypothetical protein